MNNPYVNLLAELTGPADDWRDEAACLGTDPEIWFTDNQGETENRRKLIQAKSICRGCPVQIQCLDFARSTHQRFGVWGGQKMIEPSTRERTHCLHGHEYTKETAYYDPNGQRRCGICRKRDAERAAAAKRERRAAERAARQQVSA